MIDASTRLELLQLARVSLEARVRRRPPPPLPSGIDVNAFGVFVTLYHRDDLRGCLGALDCPDRIIESVARLASAVAHEDHRFEPLREHELPRSIIDLSLLTPPERVHDHLSIEVGRHGLIVEHGARRGLLLPQVAPEHGWDRLTFLSHTCLKAGLHPDAWQRGATVWQFEAEVFGEEACGSAHDDTDGSQRPR